MNIIENAEKKLREARFHRDQMIKHDRMAFNHDEEKFNSCLSAFLTAGMSVRGAFHVRQDRKRNEAVKKWKKAWEDRLIPEEKSLWDFMHEDRNHEVHEGGSSPTVKTENRELGKLGPGTHSSVTIAVQPGVPLPSIQVAAYYFDGTERNVREACDEYLALLERMVADFKLTEPI